MEILDSSTATKIDEIIDKFMPDVLAVFKKHLGDEISSNVLGNLLAVLIAHVISVIDSNGNQLKQQMIFIDTLAAQVRLYLLEDASKPQNLH